MTAQVSKKQVLDCMTFSEVEFHKFFCGLEYVKYSIQKGKVYERKAGIKVLENENKFLPHVNDLISKHKNSWDVLPPGCRTLK